MDLEDAKDLPTAYLILRHLYDGDAIEWPIPEEHPFRYVFAALETQGYVARWDRMWPLRDRYRLTDKGIAAIEAVYQPAGAEAIYNQLRGRKLTAAERRAYLQQQGYDPVLWPALHDPTTHWERYRYERGGYHDWFWDDEDDDRRTWPPAPPRALGALPYVVDLDREATARHAARAARDEPDRDVS